jgi:hypothetical protein
LNNEILKLTKNGLEGYGTTVMDDDLLKYYTDILKLCRQDVVSEGRLYASIVIDTFQSITQVVAHQSMKMVCIHSSCYCKRIILTTFNQDCESLPLL